MDSHRKLIETLQGQILSIPSKPQKHYTPAFQQMLNLGTDLLQDLIKENTLDESHLHYIILGTLLAAHSLERWLICGNLDEESLYQRFTMSHLLQDVTGKPMGNGHPYLNIKNPVYQNIQRNDPVFIRLILIMGYYFSEGFLPFYSFNQLNILFPELTDYFYLYSQYLLMKPTLSEEEILEQREICISGMTKSHHTASELKDIDVKEDPSYEMTMNLHANYAFEKQKDFVQQGILSLLIIHLSPAYISFIKERTPNPIYETLLSEFIALQNGNNLSDILVFSENYIFKDESQSSLMIQASSAIVQHTESSLVSEVYSEIQKGNFISLYKIFQKNLETVADLLFGLCLDQTEFFTQSSEDAEAEKNVAMAARDKFLLEYKVKTFITDELEDKSDEDSKIRSNHHSPCLSIDSTSEDSQTPSPSSHDYHSINKGKVFIASENKQFNSQNQLDPFKTPPKRNANIRLSATPCSNIDIPSNSSLTASPQSYHSSSSKTNKDPRFGFPDYLKFYKCKLFSTHHKKRLYALSDALNQLDNDQDRISLLKRMCDLYQGIIFTEDQALFPEVIDKRWTTKIDRDAKDDLNKSGSYKTISALLQELENPKNTLGISNSN